MSADNDFSISRIAIRQKEMRLFIELERKVAGSRVLGIFFLKMRPWSADGGGASFYATRWTLVIASAHEAKPGGSSGFSYSLSDLFVPIVHLCSSAWTFSAWRAEFGPGGRDIRKSEDCALDSPSSRVHRISPNATLLPDQSHGSPRENGENMSLFD